MVIDFRLYLDKKWLYSEQKYDVCHKAKNKNRRYFNCPYKERVFGAGRHKCFHVLARELK